MSTVVGKRRYIYEGSANILRSERIRKENRHSQGYGMKGVRGSEY